MEAITMGARNSLNPRPVASAVLSPVVWSNLNWKPTETRANGERVSPKRLSASETQSGNSKGIRMNAAIRASRGGNVRTRLKTAGLDSVPADEMGGTGYP